MRRRPYPLFVLLASVALPSAAHAQSTTPPPAPALVSPADGREFPPPSPRDVRFVVKGQPDEGAGTLKIQLADADADVDGKGSFVSENGIAEYTLEQTEPGGNLYAVTVPAADFGSYSGGELYWQAYRSLPEGSCTPTKTAGKFDCFQESKDPRTFQLLDPSGYGNYEPNDSAATATPANDFFARDCAYLEETGDVDWYAFNGRAKAFDLRLRIFNDADSDRWRPLGSPKRMSADMSASVYAASNMRKVASIHVRVGKSKVLKERLRPRKGYLLAIRHAGNGNPKAKPAPDMSYRWRFNFRGAFDDVGGCV
jgi:hypothetical protein